MKLTTRHIALMAMFAALYVVLSYIAPIKIPTGVGDIEISFAAMIATIFGLVLGPYLGGAAALLGSAVAWTLTGMSPANLPFIIAPALNALVTGFIFYRKWKFGFVTFALLIIAFIFTPPIMPITENWIVAIAVLFDKIFALFLIIPLAFFGKKIAVAKGVSFFGKKINVAQGAIFFFLLAFVGNQADNMGGSFAFSLPLVYNGIWGYTVDTVRGFFLLSPFLYPAIRIIQAIIAMVIAVPLIKLLKGRSWLWSEKTILDQDEPTEPNAKKSRLNRLFK
jgi:ECF transporter S component (folate family)